MSTLTHIARRERPIAVDVFSGIGGLSLGMEAAGFDVVAAVELDPHHAAVHRFNFPNTMLLQQNAVSLGSGELSRAVAEGAAAHGRNQNARLQVDVVAGGPPCQGFSTGGMQDPDDERNQLVLAFAEIVNVLKPRFFVMENVPGLLQDKHVKLRERLMRSFKKAGYTAGEPVVLNACDFGVPQKRRRLFLFGWKDGEAPIIPPTPTVSLPVTVRAAFGLLPDAGRFEHLYSSDVLAMADLDYESRRKMSRKGSEFAQAMRAVSFGNGFVRPWVRDAFTGMCLTAHELAIVRRFKAVAPGTRDSVSRYARLSWSGQSPTVRSGTGSDRGSHTPPRPIHPSGDRVVTVREAARLQSFPDWFCFHATKWHAWRGIGNAVPPLLAHAVMSRVADRFVLPPTPRVVLPFSDLRSLGYAQDAIS